MATSASIRIALLLAPPPACRGRSGGGAFQIRGPPIERYPSATLPCLRRGGSRWPVRALHSFHSPTRELHVHRNPDRQRRRIPAEFDFSEVGQARRVLAVERVIRREG